MPNSIEHEEKRWDYMTGQQLETRLNRITSAKKLINFYEEALKRSYASLARKAMLRAQSLHAEQFQCHLLHRRLSGKEVLR